jgi:hypothetical protein
VTDVVLALGLQQMHGDDWVPEGFEQWSNARGWWEVFGETDPNRPWTVGPRHLVDCVDYSSSEPAGADHRRAHDPRS